MKITLKWLPIALAILLIIYQKYPEPTLPPGAVIDKIVVEKSLRTLKAYQKGVLLKTYTVSLGFAPKGEKEIEGDGKTPEGTYQINDKNPHSGYFLNLGVSYPNQTNRDTAKKLGKSAGGDIKIHGMRNRFGFVGKLHRWVDWTDGCIAVTNAEMQELYDHTAIGTVIELQP